MEKETQILSILLNQDFVWWWMTMMRDDEEREINERIHSIWEGIKAPQKSLNGSSTLFLASKSRLSCNLKKLRVRKQA